MPPLHGQLLRALFLFALGGVVFELGMMFGSTEWGSTLLDVAPRREMARRGNTTSSDPEAEHFHGDRYHGVGLRGVETQAESGDVVEEHGLVEGEGLVREREEESAGGDREDVAQVGAGDSARLNATRTTEQGTDQGHSRFPLVGLGEECTFYANRQSRRAEPRITSCTPELREFVAQTDDFWAGVGVVYVIFPTPAPREDFVLSAELNVMCLHYLHPRLPVEVHVVEEEPYKQALETFKEDKTVRVLRLDVGESRKDDFGNKNYALLSSAFRIAVFADADTRACPGGVEKLVNVMRVTGAEVVAMPVSSKSHGKEFFHLNHSIGMASVPEEFNTGFWALDTESPAVRMFLHEWIEHRKGVKIVYDEQGRGKKGWNDQKSIVPAWKKANTKLSAPLRVYLLHNFQCRLLSRKSDQLEMYACTNPHCWVLHRPILKYGYGEAGKLCTI